MAIPDQFPGQVPGQDNPDGYSGVCTISIVVALEFAHIPAMCHAHEL